MEVIPHEIKHGKADVFNLYPLGDFHLGSIDCQEKGIERIVDQVRSDRRGYWVGMGDYLDCITKSDKRFRSGSLAPWVKPGDIIESQRKRFNELMYPIKDKCWGLLTGNHEEAIHAKHDDDIGRHLASDLGVPYGSYTAFILVTFTRGSGGKDGKKSTHLVTIHAWHGAGAAQTEGARLMRLMRLVNEFTADVYLMGHLHCITLYTPERQSVVAGRIKDANVIAAITGSWLKGYPQPKAGEERGPTYVEEKGYKPSRLGCPIIHIKPFTKEFSIEV